MNVPKADEGFRSEDSPQVFPHPRLRRGLSRDRERRSRHPQTWV